MGRIDLISEKQIHAKACAENEALNKGSFACPCGNWNVDPDTSIYIAEPSEAHTRTSAPTMTV